MKENTLRKEREEPGEGLLNGASFAQFNQITDIQGDLGLQLQTALWRPFFSTNVHHQTQEQRVAPH